MTRTEIQQLVAGAQMDGLLAEAFMGYPACVGATASFIIVGYDPTWFGGPNKGAVTCPAYSTEAGPCLQLVAELNKTHLLETSQYWAEGGHKGGVLGFRAVFRGFTESAEEANRATGRTLMEAVGRAALLSFIQQPFQPGERVLYTCPSDDFTSGPVTITRMPERVSQYDLVEVTSADGQVYPQARYADLKALTK